MTATVYRWIRNGANLLPVDPQTRGPAYLVGWWNGTASIGTGGPLAVPAGTTVWSSRPYTNPVAVDVEPYTAAISSTGPITLALVWVSADAQELGRATAAGTSRITVTALPPAGCVGALLAVTTTTTVTVSDPVLVASTVDPGPLPPLPAIPLAGDQWFSELPEMYRVADAADTSTANGYPLRAYLRANGDGVDQAMYITDRMAAGEFTDPTAADDGWIPWLAQAAGVKARPSLTETRALIASKRVAAQPGTPAAILALTRTWLTGTQVCDLVPSGTPFTMELRVRSDQIPNGDTNALKALLLASGLLPAGFTLVIGVGSPTWTAVDTTTTGTWAGADLMDPWQIIDSQGVTGT